MNLDIRLFLVVCSCCLVVVDLGDGHGREVGAGRAPSVAGGDVTDVVLVALTTGARVVFGVADAVLISTIVRRRKPRRRCWIDENGHPSFPAGPLLVNPALSVD